MARLADLIAAGEVQPPPWLVIGAKDLAGWRESIRDTLDRCQIIVVDDVVDLYFGTENPHAWEIGADFPNLAAPSPVCWLEGRRPSAGKATGSVGSGDRHGLPTSWGWLFESADVGHLAGQQRTVSPREADDVRRAIQANWPLVGAEIDAAVAAHGEIARDHLPDYLRHYYDIRQELADLDAGRPLLYPAGQKTEVRATLFQEDAGRLAVGPQYRLDLLLDDRGGVIKYSGGPIFSQGAPNQPPPGLVRSGLDLAKPMLLAISLMRCPDAVLTNCLPPTRLSRAHEKRHGRPQFSYQSLGIEPIRARMGREARNGESDLRRALRACADDSPETAPASTEEAV